MKRSDRQTSRPLVENRRGAIFAFAAILFAVVLSFVVLTIDTGFIALTRAEMRTAADGAALAGASELASALTEAGDSSSLTAQAAASDAAVRVAASNSNGDQAATLVSASRDVRFGRYVFNSRLQQWEKLWDQMPFNMVGITVRRDQGTSSAGDGQIPLFFANAIGVSHAGVAVNAVSAFVPGSGFRITAGSSASVMVLPIAIDEQSWNSLLTESGSDDYTWNPGLQAVYAGSDGVKELNIYPDGSSSLPPGNRGTVDIGSCNNSTSDLSRQITDGLNASDLAYHGGELRWDDGSLVLEGDPGLSAGISSALQSQIGKVKAAPVFSMVSGPGNNARYHITKFVGVRLLDVKLTGGPTVRKLIVQPAPFVSSNVIRGQAAPQVDSVYAPPFLVE